MIVFVIMYVAALFCVFVGYVTVFELLKEGRGACVHGREHLKSLLLTAEPAFVSLDYGVAAGKLKAKGANTRTENLFRRIASAKSSLETTNVPLKNIAYGCGFSSSNYFSYAFRRENGITPREYRKLHNDSIKSQPVSQPFSSRVKQKKR